jgi:hypothetical protein
MGDRCSLQTTCQRGNYHCPPPFLPRDPLPVATHRSGKLGPVPNGATTRSSHFTSRIRATVKLANGHRQLAELLELTHPFGPESVAGAIEKLGFRRPIYRQHSQTATESRPAAAALAPQRSAEALQSAIPCVVNKTGAFKATKNPGLLR